MRIENVNGKNLVCGHIFRADEIKIGSHWYAADGSSTKAVVTNVCDNGLVTYKWNVNGCEKEHTKESFAFQCRFCLSVA